VLSFLKRFWWAIAFVAVFCVFLLRSRLRQARMADGLQLQRDIERKAIERYREAGRTGRAAKSALDREIRASRDAWDKKKAELEREMGQDEDGLKVAWKRAFGSDPGKRREESDAD